MRRILALALALLACFVLALAGPAQAERKVALVIGNGAYRVGPLKNAVNDAEDISAALRGLGFKVALLKNADNRHMDEAVRQFAAGLKPGVLGLFYFSGHGLELGGVNYLVPVNAHIQSDADIKNGCLSAQWVLDKMEDAGNGLNVMILDACRDNPFPRNTKSTGQGLAGMNAPDGSLIAFATGPGRTASDGTGRNGAYTKHLLQNLSTPGLSLVDMFMRTQGGVRQESQKAQIPWVSFSLSSHVYLAGPAPGAQARPTQSPDLAAERKRVAEETDRLKREQQELAQLQAEKQRMEAERQKLEQAKAAAQAQAPKQTPLDEATATSLLKEGVAASGRGDKDEAIRLYTKALDAGGLSIDNQVVAFNNRGNAYKNKGQYDRAIQDYDQALRLKPDYAEAFNNRGIAYWKKGQFDRAIQDYDQAIRLKPDDALAYGNRAFARKALGQIDQAKADAKRALELDPKVKVPSF